MAGLLVGVRCFQMCDFWKISKSRKGGGKMARASKPATFEKKLREAMKNMGTYRVEYDETIRICAELLSQRESIKKMLNDEDYVERTPGVITVEKLRTDIAKYLDMLCLSPKVFEKTTVKEKPKTSKLDAALSALMDG